MFDDAEMPRNGEVWQDHKGEFYVVVDVEFDEATSEDEEPDYIVRYRPARGAYMWRIFSRSVRRGKGFLTDVTSPGLPGPVPRFERAARDELGYPVSRRG